MSNEIEVEIIRSPYYSKGIHECINSSFNLTVPEIYQLEVTNACNFKCDFCPTGEGTTGRPPVLLDPLLAKKISERDLEGSYFVEFQLSGEPLLHKQLKEIISYFKGKVLTGLSTNGDLIDQRLDALCELDYLTISVDSIERYSDFRKGGDLQKLISNIGLLLRHRPSSLTIDLQMIEFEGLERQLELLSDLVKEKGWEDDLKIRTVPDCFLGTTREKVEVDRKDMCLNPWMSVSVQADGDVTSCCFSFGKEIVYGNLNEQSLQEIWESSEELSRLRQEHLQGNLRSICSQCYMRSPVLLHWDFYTDVVTRRLK